MHSGRTRPTSQAILGLMRCAWLLISSMSIAACGGDDDTPGAVDAAIDGASESCGTTGSGTINGTVGGATISPVVRAQQFAIGGAGVVIVLDEVGGACGEVATTGEHLVLGFCDPPAAGTYTVVGEQAFGCPGPDTFGLIEQDGGNDFGESLGGTITISATDGGCVRGSFDISFMAADGPGTPESMSGTFGAVVCP